MSAAASVLQQFFKGKYIVRCDTCGKIFFEGELDVSLGILMNAQMPEEWYVDACKHWLENQEHDVNVYMDTLGTKICVFPLSQMLTRRNKEQGITNEQLAAEIAMLRKRLSKKNGGWTL